MARLEIGNILGICAVDKPDDTLLGTVVTDTANGFTVTAADIKNFFPGQIIDAVTKTTGVTGAGFIGRIVQSVDTVTNTVVYTGADATLTTLFGIYLTGQWELAAPLPGTAGTVNDPYANVNGGPAYFSGIGDANYMGDLQAMRNRLQAISATTYSNAQLDLMTYNDLVYACRINDYPGSIK